MPVHEKIEERVHHYYWDLDINCARTVLYCLGELFNVKIQTQTMHAAIGMHGAGLFRAQCGLVEGSLMFIGVYFSERGKTDSEIADLCYRFAEQFTQKFSSLQCRDLRPNGFTENDPPHLCEKLTVDAICFAYSFINAR